MSVYDYIVIGFFLVFMLSLGPVYKSFSKTASDYFRGGGGMLWWVVGSSSFMTTFSAWSFTGGAARAYETGTFFMILFGCNILALVFTYFFTAARFRQMRIVTAIDSIRKRYGNSNEQVFAWLPTFFKVAFGGIALYGIAVFIYGVFKIDMSIIIIGLGVTAVVITLVGGAWAATAGDFVQMMIVLVITILMAGLALWHEDVGGPAGFISKIPDHHLDWTQFDRWWIIIVFIVAQLMAQLFQMNSMHMGAAKYVFVKDGKDAKKSVLISIAGFLFLSPIWVIPAIAATMIFPDLSVDYPGLQNPNEAAYVAMAIDLLPAGLLGLMVCAIFAASMTTLNTDLNVISGTLVRNFYIRVINKSASERRQIFIGRMITLLVGVLWVGVGLFLAKQDGLDLFYLTMIAAAVTGIPTSVPLFFGMFVKRTPSWSAWSTMASGFVVAIALNGMVVGDIIHLTPEFITGLFNPEVPFSDREIGDLRLGLTNGVLAGFCTLWYFGTMFFYKKESPEYKKQVDEFFVEMHTPIDNATESENGSEGDKRQYGVLSNLCLIYGGATMLLLAVPNEFRDRMLIFACGGVVAGVGYVLRRIGQKC
ncbi:hypothetical protein MLD52_21015 [Puniceicoccaceae bacterium K14]|nr:hypothetical protein [Puniceicoccaceae bacterium K14]